MGIDVFYNGDNISEFFDVKVGFRRGLVQQRINSAVSVGDRDGTVFQKSHFEAMKLTMPFVMHGGQERKWRELARLLDVESPKPLIFGDEPDKYYMAMPASSIDFDELFNHSNGQIEWECYDPYAISTTVSNYSWDDAMQVVNLPASLRGKIHGDLTNPHSAYVAAGLDIVSRPPSLITHEIDQHDYMTLYSQDGNTMSFANGDKGNVARVMFSFNIVAAVEASNAGIWNKYGVLNDYEKVTWVKTNLKSLNIKVWSWGHGSNSVDPNNGYRSAVQLWDGQDWSGTQVNHAKAPELNQYNITAVDDLNARIDANGFVYVVAFANVSDGAKQSEIHVDYASLDGQLRLPVSDSITIDYEGTYPAPVTFEVINKSDNGFIGLITDDAVIQVGNTQEADGNTVEKSQMLLDDSFESISSNWRVNGGYTRYSPKTAVHIGAYGARTVNRSRTYVSSFGADGHPGVWHGPTLYREIPADKDNIKGARDFISDNYIVFNGNANGQLGVQEINITDDKGKFLMGFMIRNYTWNNTRNEMSFWVGDKQVWKEESDRWNHFTGRIVMSKNGDRFTFKLDKLEAGRGNTSATFSYKDTSLTDKLGFGLTLWSSVWDKAHAVDMGIYGVQFKKMNMTDWVNIPNTYTTGDKLRITSDNNKVETYVNDSLMLINQDVGSQPILVKPGRNNIQIAYSTWATRPDVTATVRARYL